MNSCPAPDTPLLEKKPLAQVGIVVRDIEKTAAVWSALLGVDPPPVMHSGHSPDRPTRFEGNPTKAEARLAFFELPNLQLELIQPLGGESTWQQFLDQHGEGLHHIAFWVKDINGCEKKLRLCGMPLEQSGGWQGGGYSYLNGSSSLGCVLELLENFNT